MSYIGNQPAESYSAFQKQDFTTSATTSYTLDHPVANQNELALFINFVRQEPTASYTASGTSLTLTSATSVGDDMYCVYLGKAVQTVNPPSGSVGLAQLSATGTKSSSTFLRGDNTFDTPPLGGITSVTTFRLTANITGGSDATISANLSAVSSPSGYGQIGSQVTQSSGIFTFPSTGIWSIEAFGVFINVAGDTSCELKTQVTTDNSSYNDAAAGVLGENDSDNNRGTVFSKFIFDVTNTSTHKCLFRQVSFAGGTSLQGNADDNRTYFIFTRLGDT